jgi:toxin ParE1/3/4
LTAKPVVPRDAAKQDVEGAIDFYVREAGEVTALRFIANLESAYGAIGRQPGTGSPRYGYELDVPGLRARLMGRFPYLIFYVECDDRVDVWRVLHAHRDIPSWLQPPSA